MKSIPLRECARLLDARVLCATEILDTVTVEDVVVSDRDQFTTSGRIYRLVLPSAPISCIM